VDPGNGALNLQTGYQYDAAGNRVKVTDPNGAVGYFYYDAANRLILQVDPVGYATRTDYDSAGQLAKVTRYWNPTSGATVTTQPTITTNAAKDAVTTFTRDKLERLTETKDAEGYSEKYELNGFGDVWRLTNKLTGVTTKLYDHVGRLASESRAITWTTATGTAQSQTVTTTYQYDPLGNRFQMIEAQGSPDQRTTNYGYDLDGRLTDESTSVYLSSTSTAVVHTKQTQYDQRGNAVKITDGALVPTYTYYDLADRKIAQVAAVDPVDGLGSLTQWTYYANGDLKTTTTFAARVAPTAAGGAQPGTPSGASRQTAYVYDAASRLISTAIDNVLAGRMSDAGYLFGVTDILNQTSYDPSGNVRTVTDGNGGVTFFYYDYEGRRTAKIDAGGFLTTYQLDAEGRVRVETAFATPATSFSLATYTAPAASADDRITTSDYDRNGNLLSQARSGVQASSVAANGALTTATATATVSYSYDALGDVIAKTDANNAVTLQKYDSFGRQIRVLQQAYLDYRGVSVTPTTETSYNGLDLVTQTIARGDGTTSAGDRTTTYVYGAGGRLVSVTDPVGLKKTFTYDQVGRETIEQYDRKKSDTTTTETDGVSIVYDAAGREISRKAGVLNGTVWAYGDTQDLFYDGFGDLIARGANTGGQIANAQEFADHDNAGRVWRTNFGDGVTKAYAYDLNGNATALLQGDGGIDLRAKTDLAAVLNDTTGKISITMSAYDTRNELIDTKQPQSNNLGASPVHAVPVDVTGAGTQYFNANVGLSDAAGIVGTGAVSTTLQSASVVAASGGGVVTFQHTSRDTRQLRGSYPIFTDNYTVTIPNNQIADLSGGGSIHVVVTDTFGYSNTIDYAPGTLVLPFSIGPMRLSGERIATIVVMEDLGTGLGQRLIAQATLSGNNTTPVQVALPAEILIRNENPAATVLRLFARIYGTAGPYVAVNTSQVVNAAGAAVAGWYTVDMSQPPFNGGTPNTTWEVKYLALDAAGNILDSREGQIATSGGYANTNFWAGQVGGPGQVMITRNGTQDWVIFSGILPAGATQARLRYRPAGSNGAWSGYIAVGNNAYGQPGLFGTQITGIVGTQEFWLETLDGAGNVVGDRRYGQFTAGGQAPAMGAYRPSSKQVLLTPLSGTTTQKFRYLTSGGSWSAWSTLNSGGQWSFDGSAIVPDFLSTTTTSYEYDNYNGSTPISHTTGTLTLGFAGQSVTMNAGVSAPAKVQFSPLQSNAASITVYWRDKDSIGPFYKAVVPKSGGTFGWDVDAAGVRPTSGTHNIEYYYDAYDGNGTLLPPLNGDDHMHGYIAIQSNQYALTDDFQIQWVVDFNDASRFLIDRKQKFNAFGEIKSETDGRGNVTTFDYNTLGKLITKTEPIVAVTSEAGVTANVNPVENYYYDLGGRLVAQQDANGNILKQTLLTGSGQGGAGALTLKEFHPDGGAKAFGYDVFGDLRTSTDELNAVTAYDYDNASRLSEVDHAARTSGNSVGTQLKDYYLYDVLGERTRHWNSQLGSTVVETTDYDAQQRVTQTVTFGGLTTAYAYQWLGAAGGQLSTAGLGNFGGWQTTTTEASGLTHSEKADVFGHTVSRLDLGAHSYAYTYNLAGELLHQSNSAGQSIDYTYYTNGYIASVTDNVLHMLSTFEYDNDGNRTLETYNNISNATIFYQNAVVSYDALNRVTEFKDAKADITYAYDANGNRREVKSVYHDGLNGAMQTQDYWYKYDGMNRFVLTMGTLSGGQIGVGTTGVAINYNAAGERATATYSGANPHTETYSYSADGYLENTTIAGVVRASRTNDAMGRMTSYVQNTAANATDMSRTNIQYDGDNRIVSETDLDVTNGNVTTTVTNDYKALVGSAYTGADQGVITHTKSVRSSGPTTDTTYSYVMWDEAKQSGIQIKGDDPNNPNSYKWASGFSQLTYDVNGHLLQAIDNTYQLAGKTVQRVLTYQSDAYGQVLVREEKDAGVLGPRQLYYYFNGHRIGDVGNNGPNPSLEDYAQELAEDRSKTQTGGFRFGHPVASADFDENYQPINSSYPLGAASAYTVRTGDTLRSIALSLWGDDSLWYLIAEANGLGASTLLVAGQTLSIPNKVTNLHNTSSTFRVYNPGEAIGDALPTLPPEPKPPHASCFAQIVLAVISFAVAWYMPVLLPALGPVLSTVVTAAAANVVSQGIGVATGLQDHFSWRDVAVSALTAGVIQGVGGIPGLGSGLSGAIVRGAVSNVLTQGVEVAVGLQRRFDWASVAADAIGSGAGYEAGVTLDKTFGTNTFGTDAYQPRDPKNFGTNLGSAAAYAVASSATRSLINGSSFGTNLGAALPGVIGSTIGNLVAGRMADDRSARMDAMLGGVDRAEARIAAGNPGSYEVADLGGTGKSQPGLLSRIWGDIKEAGAWLGDLTGITDGHIGLGQSSLKINSPPPDGTTVSELVVTARHPLAAADAANRYGYYLASAAHDGRSINRASALTTYNQYQGQLRYIVAQPRTTPEERNAALGASQYLFQGANAAGLRGVTQLPFSSGPYAVASMAFGGGGPSPRLMMNTGEISLGPSAAPKILQAPSGAIVELPAQASLSRADARSWYVSQDANIPNLIDRSATLEQQAYQASGLRNAFRSTSRDSMVNFSVANDLNLTRPNLTWQQTVQKYNGDYAEIISASQRSNRQVNSQFNINP
jgi:YD repeat-containing protein